MALQYCSGVFIGSYYCSDLYRLGTDIWCWVYVIIMGINIAALRHEMNMINRYEITQYVQEDIFQDETSLERLFCDIGRFRQKCWKLMTEQFNV